jgi:hypothetical protein
MLCGLANGGDCIEVDSRVPERGDEDGSGHEGCGDGNGMKVDVVDEGVG